MYAFMGPTDIYSAPHLGRDIEKNRTGANPAWPSGAPGKFLIARRAYWPVTWPVPPPPRCFNLMVSLSVISSHVILSQVQVGLKR